MKGFGGGVCGSCTFHGSVLCWNGTVVGEPNGTKGPLKEVVLTVDPGGDPVPNEKTFVAGGGDPKLA